jgi:hypothetical protein
MRTARKISQLYGLGPFGIEEAQEICGQGEEMGETEGEPENGQGANGAVTNIAVYTCI